jgi:hypothetical protein
MDTFNYTTVSGDTFDSIALDFFDDEKYSASIIELNPDHAGVLRFNAGVVLLIPNQVETTSDTLPPWK